MYIVLIILFLFFFLNSKTKENYSNAWSSSLNWRHHRLGNIPLYTRHEHGPGYTAGHLDDHISDHGHPHDYDHVHDHDHDSLVNSPTYRDYHYKPWKHNWKFPLSKPWRQPWILPYKSRPWRSNWRHQARNYFSDRPTRSARLARPTRPARLAGFAEPPDHSLRSVRYADAI